MTPHQVINSVWGSKPKHPQSIILPLIRLMLIPKAKKKLIIPIMILLDRKKIPKIRRIPVISSNHGKKAATSSVKNDGRI